MPYRAPMPLILLALVSLSLFSYSQFSYAASRPSAEVIKETYAQAGCSSDPFVFLDNKQRHSAKGNPNSVVTPVPGQSAGIDPVLACRLMKLMEFMESQSCPVTINSAQRNKQVCDPNGGACAKQGNSCHQYGLAVDVGGNSRCLELLTSTIGRKNPNGRFGLHVAYVENGNYRHIQCVEHLVANASSAGGCRMSCDGKTKINLDTSAGTDGRSPTSGITDGIRRALGLDPQPQQQQPPPPMQQQALQQAQQPSQYFPTSQPTTNSGTAGSSGSTGSTGSTGASSPVSALSPESQAYLGVTQSSAYQPSISEQLLQMAYGTTTQNIPQNTGTTVPLYLNQNDVGTVRVQNAGIVSTTSEGGQNPSIGTLQPSQTFTSSDLNYAPRVEQTYTPPQTGIFAVLETLKTILLRMLEILRPMGIRNAIQGTAHVDEHAE